MTKIEKKFRAKSQPASGTSAYLIHRLENICKGLIYVSEVDSPVEVFLGRAGQDPRATSMLEQLGDHTGEPVREIDFGTFFDRLTTTREWHGEREHARTKKFLDLRKLIEEGLTHAKVYKIGEIRVRIVAAGLDPDGRAVGVTMTALET